MLAMHVLFHFCLVEVSSGVSEALMLDLQTLSSSCCLAVSSGISEVLMLDLRNSSWFFLVTVYSGASDALTFAWYNHLALLCFLLAMHCQAVLLYGSLDGKA